MQKFSKYFAAGAMVLAILPVAASANNDGNKGKSAEHNMNGIMHRILKGSMHKNYSGTVTAVSATNFTITDSKGTVYTVTLAADAKITRPFSTVALVLSDIKVTDKVEVKGTLSGSTITAKTVVVTKAGTHKASTVGTVTAVSGNTITVQNTHTGVVSNVTVKTDANTTVDKDGSPATTADVTVGSKVGVKGLWDETLNVLNAIKISIRTMFSK